VRAARAMMIGGVIAAALPVAAQVRPVPPIPPANPAQIQARHEISALEGILENAVRYGAQMLTQHVQAASLPDMVMLTGMARARGFRLDGYGVLFDVEFPSIRRSVMWSMRALQRPDPELLAAMRELRKNMPVADVAARRELDRVIKELEGQVQAFDARNRGQQMQQRGPAGNLPVAAATNGTPDAASGDPRAIYVSDITSALVDAILDHGAPVGVGADEWLTVAARESADRGFSADPNDTAMTFILRIKGSELNALRDRRLSREEARKRVEIKQY
jgi:hypothetical protein